MANYRAELAVAIFAIAVLVGYVVMLGSVGPRPTPDDVAIGPASPIGVPIPPVERAVYLAPIGDFPRADADALVAHYLEKFDLAIEVLPSIPVPSGAMDAERDQLVAERLLDAIAATDVVAADPEAVVIGLTDVDMYIAARDWRYAYGLRSGGTLAIVSAARMDDGFATEERQGPAPPQDGDEEPRHPLFRARGQRRSSERPLPGHPRTRRPRLRQRGLLTGVSYWRSAAAFSAQRMSRIFVTSATGMGLSAAKRIVPLPNRCGASSSPHAWMTASLAGKRL